jgi:hypothetical protein
MLYLSLFASIVSIYAFIYFFGHQEILIIGDATAHIHIARRVFDSRTPGLMQLGTVWLPLPHILLIPFILPIGLWRSGVGGSIPSMIAYVAGTLGVFRLVRGVLPQSSAGRIAAWGAALIYALNPNLLYLQSTAMTESLALTLFVWATVYFSEFVQATRTIDAEGRKRRSRSLRRCGWMLMAAMLTRYDGWFAAAAFAPAAVAVFWQWTGGRTTFWRSPLRPALVRFLVILAIAPTLWFVYNAWNWGNPLEFANGPYSASAIAERTERNGWRHPGWHAPVTGTIYYLKAAKMSVAGGVPQRVFEHQRTPFWRLENAWVPLALLGTALLLVLARTLWPLLLLWVPLPFYVLSIAWGGATIFVEVWWPYSNYNVRYGLQMLPAFAVFTALALYFALSRFWHRKYVVFAASAVFALFVASCYVTVCKASPVSLREGRANNLTRFPFDQEIANELARLRPGVTVQMYTAHHAAALELAGFPLRRTINETNEKLWPAALENPGSRTDYVVAYETPDDPVWHAVQDHLNELQLTAVLSGTNEPRAFFYQRKPPAERSLPTPAAAPATATVPVSNEAKADDSDQKESQPKQIRRGRKAKRVKAASRRARRQEHHTRASSHRSHRRR